MTSAVEELRHEIVAAVSDLVAIPSIAPFEFADPARADGQEAVAAIASAPPGGEQRAALYLQELMEASGLSTELVTVEDGRPNVAGRLPGGSGGRSLMFVGHLDVVPPGPLDRWTVADPWSATEVDGRLYGRGTADMKAGDVCAIFACRVLRDLGLKPAGDLSVALAVGEEVMDTANGIGALLDAGYRADAAIVMEPTARPRGGLEVGWSSRGQLIVGISVRGLPVHLSYRGMVDHEGSHDPTDGVSAIDKAQVVQAALAALDETWQRQRRPGRWRTTLYPLVIDAGSSSLATTPDRCTLWYAAYFHPDEDVDTVEGEIRRAVSAVAAGDWWLRDHPPEVHRAMVWPPFRTDPEAPIAAVLSQALVRVQGDGPSLGPLGYVCDASFVREAGIDTVLLGPGDIRVAHSFDEHVEVDDLMIATKVYALAAAEWCRGR